MMRTRISPHHPREFGSRDHFPGSGSVLECAESSLDRKCADLIPIYNAVMKPDPSLQYGFLTDATLCIGCKACEVACKQWNQLPADSASAMVGLSGFSYDNTIDLGATTWRHVAFIEQDSPAGVAWLMLSDVCKHCVHAGCLDACPTGAIVRTEFDTVVIQDNICNGCGYCVPACPFGVPQLDRSDGGSHKCTLCYDRLLGGMTPACAKSCPTDSIRFGLVAELREDGRQRVDRLRSEGVDAHFYGDEHLGGTGGIGGLNAMFVLNGSPSMFGLPARPSLPGHNIKPAAFGALLTAAGFTLLAMISMRRTR